VRLERGRERAATLEELRTTVDRAIAGLDQSLAIITALLRIAEIEHSRRLEGFGEVPLAALMREVGDLYEPIAEDKRVTFGSKLQMWRLCTATAISFSRPSPIWSTMP